MLRYLSCCLSWFLDLKNGVWFDVEIDVALDVELDVELDGEVDLVLYVELSFMRA